MGAMVARCGLGSVPGAPGQAGRTVIETSPRGGFFRFFRFLRKRQNRPQTRMNAHFSLFSLFSQQGNEKHQIRGAAPGRAISAMGSTHARQAFTKAVASAPLHLPCCNRQTVDAGRPLDLQASLLEQLRPAKHAHKPHPAASTANVDYTQKRSQSRGVTSFTSFAYEVSNRPASHARLDSSLIRLLRSLFFKTPKNTQTGEV